ncbi:MAG: hydrogenase nickel incorporation protein HypB [Polyangiaceae bacterium]|nr:hydrogenase nickel incorporation protein HypB [Polyangiaceae bacterium]
MCATCGCSGHLPPADGQTENSHSHDHEHPHDHGYPHDHEHSHDHEHRHPHNEAHSHEHSKPPQHSHPAFSHAHSHQTTPTVERVAVEQHLLLENDLLARENRARLSGREVYTINLMSAPGAGKTSLLVRIVKELNLPTAVLEGDQESSLDADRIREVHVPVFQINTGTGCHLDANMVKHGILHLAPGFGSVLFVENVGNLVCPSLFDLGEHLRVVLFSVTEGADKPLKYPHMFRRADMVVFTKLDLLPYVEFDMDKAKTWVSAARPGVAIHETSVRSGAGLNELLSDLRRRFDQFRTEAARFV